MTLTLIRKLLRDVRLSLLAVALLLGAFQCLWAKVTERILGRVAPFLDRIATMAGLGFRDIEDAVFEGPGQVIRTLIGGDTVKLERAMDMLSIGYVHPLMQTIFCIWAIGRAAGAIAGELDRGTMELLLAQPLARWRVVFAHLCVDLLTIPVLCLSLWAGNWVGAWLITPIKVEEPKLKAPPRPPGYLLEIGPFKLRVADPLEGKPPTSSADRAAEREERLRVEPARFRPALWLVGGLVFAVGGTTMWLSAAGRFRWRVLGLAVFFFLVQFLVNLIGQMWDVMAPLRPLTIFYYYQPQQVILRGDWCVTLAELNHGVPLCRVPMPLVLYGVGLFGYALALWTFSRRDLPAPL
jgi:ABC-2 type transport system permease protein